MATAKAFRNILLELTHAEAETLNDVLRRVGGPPETRRGNVDAILEALAGELNFRGDYADDIDPRSGTYFLSPKDFRFERGLATVTVD